MEKDPTTMDAIDEGAAAGHMETLVDMKAKGYFTSDKVAKIRALAERLRWEAAEREARRRAEDDPPAE